MKQTILVTGGEGFIGSHLCKRLVAQGHRVISLDNHVMGQEVQVEGVAYRVGHTKDIAALIPERVDTLFHLGEYSRVEQSFNEPAFVWDLNVAGTFAVLEFARAQKCKLIYAGSSTKFSSGGAGRDESPYAWIKAANTELVRNYGSWFNFPYAITYFYNVYGSGEHSGPYGTVIEIFRQKALAHEPLTVRQPGTQKRHFTHIEDTIDGLVLVGEKGVGDDFGIGSEEAYSILEIAQMFGGRIEMLPARPGNRMEGQVVSEKTKALGWKPLRHLPEYIQSAVKKQLANEQEVRDSLSFPLFDSGEPLG